MQPFDNFPTYLRENAKWCVWVYEGKEGSKKAKRPYIAHGVDAKVDHPEPWLSYNNACLLLQSGGFNGLGFLIEKHLGITVVDIDGISNRSDELKEDYNTIYQKLNSYSEQSPSCNGWHIICGGQPASNVTANYTGIEMYCEKRYMTVTGNCFNLPNFISDCTMQLAELHEYLQEYVSTQERVKVDWSIGRSESDYDIIQKCSSQMNGALFRELYEGRWQERYHNDQSRADLAFINFLANRTQCAQQIIDIFHSSPLGQRKKAWRSSYLDLTVGKALRKLQPQTIAHTIPNPALAQSVPTGDAGVMGNRTLEEIAQAAQAEAQSQAAQYAAEAENSDMARFLRDETADSAYARPSGLMGEIMDYAYWASMKSVPCISLATAISIMSGICGRTFNTPTGTGLNTYIMVVANSGVGKEGVSQTAELIYNHILRADVRGSDRFMFSGDFSSAKGIFNKLAVNPSVAWYAGEVGVEIAKLTNRNDNNAQGMFKQILNLYNKSGYGQSFGGTSQANKADNIAAIKRPALSICGDTTWDTFVRSFDQSVISSGFLPRFLVIEYKGKTVPQNRNRVVQPMPSLEFKLQRLISIVDTQAHSNQDGVIRVPWTAEVENAYYEFDNQIGSHVDTFDLLDNANRALWNRVAQNTIRLATLAAISDNIDCPQVSMDNFLWAKKLVSYSTDMIAKKMDNGEMGSQVTQHAQVKAVQNTLLRFFTESEKTLESYKASKFMQQAGQVGWYYLFKRLGKAPEFTSTREGFDVGKAIDAALAIIASKGVIKRDEVQFGADQRSMRKIIIVTDMEGLKN